MLAEKTFSSSFIDNYASFEESLGNAKNNAIHQRRKEALRDLETLEFPHTKQEEWKYTNLRSISKLSLLPSQKPTLPAQPDWLKVPANTDVLVFVNGYFIAEWSQVVSKKIHLLTWQEAESQHADLLEKYWGKLAHTTVSYFNALNTAYAQQGLVIHLPEKSITETPIIIYQLSDTTTASAIQPRNLVIAEKYAQAKIVEIHQSLQEKGETCLFNQVTEFFVEENAHLSYFKLQNENTDITSIHTLQAIQQDRSHFSAVTISLNGGVVRNNLNIDIAGQFCETYMTGLSLLKGKTLVDNHTIANHQVPNSYSNELYKGVFDEHSTGVFNGKVFVQPDAQKTNAFQQNRNILLTNEANIYTKPQLEIWADDVKCSHGATTGQLDEDALFYLRARGIKEESARALLLKAFATEIVERIGLDFFKEYAEQYVLERLDVEA